MKEVTNEDVVEAAIEDLNRRLRVLEFQHNKTRVILNLSLTRQGFPVEFIMDCNQSMTLKDVQAAFVKLDKESAKEDFKGRLQL